MNIHWKKLALFAGGVLFGRGRDRGGHLRRGLSANAVRAMMGPARDGSPFCPFLNGGTTP